MDNLNIHRRKSLSGAFSGCRAKNRNSAATQGQHETKLQVAYVVGIQLAGTAIKTVGVDQGLGDRLVPGEPDERSG